MSEYSMLFSHQKIIAEKLVHSFKNVHVVTMQPLKKGEPQTTPVISANWIPGRRLVSTLRYLKVIIPKLVTRKPLIVFSHMTEVQSMLIAPLCWALRKKHYLWYAHAGHSPYLYLAFPFLSGVITSTSGSCPIRGRKVRYIGQSIQIEQASLHYTLPAQPPLRWYSLSRIDPSKRIETIIDCFNELRELGFPVELDIFGAPSSNKGDSYYASLTKTYMSSGDKWLRFCGKLRRSELVHTASKYDGFVHAFQGSLDKTLIEAVVCKKIVATTNREFFADFNKSLPKEFQNLNLIQQILFYLNLTELEMKDLVYRNYEVAHSKHSLDKWIEDLRFILQGDYKV